MASSSESKSSSDKVYVVLGTTGQVGGYALKHLHEAKVNVRALIRKDSQASAVIAAGATSTITGELKDTATLARAFSGAEGVFILKPSDHNPTPAFTTERNEIESIITAILTSSPRPKRIVFMSSIGAQVDIMSVIYPLHLLEQALRARVAPHIPCVFVRPGGFTENAKYEIPQAKSEAGVVRALFSVSRPFEMVSVADIGRVVAEQLLLPSLDNVHDNIKIIELEGPVKASPADVGIAFTKILNKPVTYIDLPRDQWEPMFRSHGAAHPEIRMAMFDEFNKGVLKFEGGSKIVHVNGRVTVEEALRTLIAKVEAAAAPAKK